MPPEPSVTLEGLVADLLREPLTIFAGAGLSRSAGIPVALEMQNAILRHLGCGESDINLFCRANLPFEAFFEVLLGAANCKRLLRVFQRGKPTRNHNLLAKLAHSGLVRTVVTTNFDTLIETAFEAEGIPFREYVTDEALADVAWSGQDVKLVKLHGSVKDIDAVAVSIRRVAAQRFVTNRANAVRQMLTKTPGGTILIFGYSCSDQFDISPAIRSVRDSSCRIIYVNHTEDRTAPRLQKLASAHPKHVLASLKSEDLTVNADDLIETIWRHIVNEPAPPLERSDSTWLADVDEWISELADNGRGFACYLSGLLQKAANNWSRSNELIKTSLTQGLDDLLRVRSYLAMGNNCRDLN
jgi:hypothetical protein